ncbi:Huntingtin-interacting protein 1-related protein, partial [Eschrichtius robustus]|nr:Huntingtin-interacting protein 1-related protein [Eschrichtius robustus]
MAGCRSLSSSLLLWAEFCLVGRDVRGAGNGTLGAISISKAINTQEVPVKEKHARRILPAAGRPPSLGAPGEAGSVLHDCQRYRSNIREIGDLWGHLHDRYGQLVNIYTKLLLTKISFHLKHPEFPAGLEVTDEVLEKAAGTDVNNILRNFFRRASDMLYFKRLIQIPRLPEGPPNFLRASALAEHIKPVVVIPEEAPEDEEPESLIEIGTGPPAAEPAVVADLFEQTFGPPNGSVKDDRDLQMETLKREVETLRTELDKIQLEGRLCPSPVLPVLADYLVSRAQAALDAVSALEKGHAQYLISTADASALVAALTRFSHLAADTIVHGSATSHLAPTDPADRLMDTCRECGARALELVGQLQDQRALLQAQPGLVRIPLQGILQLGQELKPKSLDVRQEELGAIVDKEMAATSAAIEDAVRRIEDMMNQARHASSGVKLEVNERILNSCTDLMKAIRLLVTASTSLQKEIVESGRGAATQQEFYAKNSRWTEGLISASKAVGWGATQLVESADKVVLHTGKYEELIVCSHEIAASTAQLVAASKVRLPSGSWAPSRGGGTTCGGETVGVGVVQPAGRPAP